MDVLSAPEVADLLAGDSVTDAVARLRVEGLTDEPGLDWLMDTAEELGHDQPRVAEELADLCSAVAATEGFIAVGARSSYLRARIHAERGELDRAIELIEEARHGWSISGHALAALRTDLGRMQILGDTGRHQQAVTVGTELLRCLDELPIGDSDEGLRGRLRATALNNLGASHSRVGDHEAALAAYGRAAAAFGALGMRAEAAQPLANRGIGLLAKGCAREALEVLEDATQAFVDGGDRLWAAKCSGNLAQAHQQVGQLVDALRVLGPARETLEELGAHAEVARLELTTAEVHLSAGLFSEAVSAAESAAERTASCGLVHDHAVATFTLALAHMESGSLERAEQELGAAARLFERVGDRHYRARVMLAQSWLASRRDRWLEAAAWADAAVVNLRAGGWLVPLAWATLQRADLAPPGEAGDRLADAAEVVDALDLPELRYAYQLRMARSCGRHGRVDEAEVLLRNAVRTVEQLGSSLPEPTLRSAFRACRLDAHDDLVELLVARGRPQDLVEACRVGDRAKAQVLTDLMTGTVGAPVRSHAGEQPDSDAELERRRAELSATYTQVSAATPAARAPLWRRAGQLEQEISSSMMRRAVEGDVQPIPDDQLGQHAMLPTDPTLGYHVVGDDVIAFVVRDGEIVVRRLRGVCAALEREVGRLTSQWQVFRMGSAFPRRHHARMLETSNRILGDMYQLVLAPLEDLLSDLPDDALTVVPHRLLHRVPFHALHDGRGYVNERLTISLRPTVVHERAGRGTVPALDAGVLVLAVPDVQAPAILREAALLSELMPEARIAVGPAATTGFLAEQLPGTTVLHLACHGLYRATNPLFSSLHLADRWFNGAEVLDLDLNGALVTLSGCESGRSDGDAAEPIGLAWAFLAAGASGAVVSQWVVDDDATAGLMASMYRHLAVGLQPAEALRRARLSTAALAPHPFHWAPFVHVASPSTSRSGARV